MDDKYDSFCAACRRGELAAAADIYEADLKNDNRENAAHKFVDACEREDVASARMFQKCFNFALYEVPHLYDHADRFARCPGIFDILISTLVDLEFTHSRLLESPLLSEEQIEFLVANIPYSKQSIRGLSCKSKSKYYEYVKIHTLHESQLVEKLIRERGQIYNQCIVCEAHEYRFSDRSKRCIYFCGRECELIFKKDSDTCKSFLMNAWLTLINVDDLNHDVKKYIMTYLAEVYYPPDL